jgi:hypothetical protein
MLFLFKLIFLTFFLPETNIKEPKHLNNTINSLKKNIKTQNQKPYRD